MMQTVINPVSLQTPHNPGKSGRLYMKQNTDKPDAQAFLSLIIFQPPNHTPIKVDKLSGFHM